MWLISKNINWSEKTLNKTNETGSFQNRKLSIINLKWAKKVNDNKNEWY